MQHARRDRKFFQNLSLKLFMQESCIPENDIKMDLRQVVNAVWAGFVSPVVSGGLI